MGAIDINTGKLLSCSDLNDEPSSITTNSTSKIFCIGYNTGEVILYKDETLSHSITLLRSKMPIRDLCISTNGKSLLACSEDSIAQFISLSDERAVVDCLPGHDGSVKACAIDPSGVYAGTTGCDGYVNVYKMEEGKVEMVKREKINETSAASVLSGPQKLKLAWSRDGKYLFIPGDYMLRYMETNQWNIIPVNEMLSNKEISLIEPLDKELLFVLTTDNAGTIWDFQSKTRIVSINVESNIIEVKYDPSSKCLSLLTNIEVLSMILDDELIKVEDQEMKDVEDLHDLLLEEEKRIPEAERYVERRESQFASLFDMQPQEHFQVNATQYNNSLRFLCWNSTGSITLLSRINSVSISFNFTNTISQRNFIIPDQYGITMAAMCSLGSILANSAQDNSIPIIQFVPFHNWRHIKPWMYELGGDEVVEVLGIGSHWAAAYTSKSFIRVFSHEGVQRFIFCMEAPVVVMCGYEDLLAVAYHQSVPLSGTQRVNLRIYNVKRELKVIADTPLALSSEATIKWIGFSEEGQLFTYDTDGILRGLLEFGGNFWTPVLDYKLISKEGEFWVVSVQKNTVSGVELKQSFYEPTLLDKDRLKVLPFNLPAFQNETSEESKFEQEYMKKKYELKQELYRKSNWEILKLFRKVNDPEYNQSSSIATEDEIAKAQKELDIVLMDKIRQCTIKGENRKAVAYAEMMQLPISLSLTLKLCQKLNKDELANKIGIILQVIFA
jgi:chromosome transmission fidelity protein 4